jgi:hypothetical protein
MLVAVLLFGGCPATQQKFLVKDANSIFQRWMANQKIRQDVGIYDTLKQLDEQKLAYVTQSMPKSYQPELHKMIPELYRPLKDEKNIAELKKNLFAIYSKLDKDPLALIMQMKEHRLGQSFNLIYQGDLDQRLATYRKFFEVLLYVKDLDLYDSLLATVANKIFEVCYYPDTFKHYYKMVQDASYRSVVNILNENMWYYLARSEWQSWNEKSLKNLKQDYDKGKEIIYIAGGSDIFQLLKHQIYRITNIDPIYPTQTRYYSEGWEYLAKGKVGDVIDYNDGNQQITLRRSYYKESGYVVRNKKVYDQVIDIPKSVTIWDIHNQKGQKLGQYKLLRRFVEQDDFKYNPNSVFLISFNELYFISTSYRYNWGINPRLFDKQIRLHVKQLRNPLNFDILQNIKTIQESDYPHVFGSSVIGR